LSNQLTLCTVSMSDKTGRNPAFWHSRCPM
jgi:hypothetical protein